MKTIILFRENKKNVGIDIKKMILYKGTPESYNKYTKQQLYSIEHDARCYIICSKCRVAISHCVRMHSPCKRHAFNSSSPRSRLNYYNNWMQSVRDCARWLRQPLTTACWRARLSRRDRETNWTFCTILITRHHTWYILHNTFHIILARFWNLCASCNRFTCITQWPLAFDSFLQITNQRISKLKNHFWPDGWRT